MEHAKMKSTKNKRPFAASSIQNKTNSEKLKTFFCSIITYSSTSELCSVFDVQWSFIHSFKL